MYLRPQLRSQLHKRFQHHVQAMEQLSPLNLVQKFRQEILLDEPSVNLLEAMVSTTAASENTLLDLQTWCSTFPDHIRIEYDEKLPASELSMEHIPSPINVHQVAQIAGSLNFIRSVANESSNSPYLSNSAPLASLEIRIEPCYRMKMDSTASGGPCQTPGQSVFPIAEVDGILAYVLVPLAACAGYLRHASPVNSIMWTLSQDLFYHRILNPCVEIASQTELRQRTHNKQYARILCGAPVRTGQSKFFLPLKPQDFIAINAQREPKQNSIENVNICDSRPLSGPNITNSFGIPSLQNMTKDDVVELLGLQGYSKVQKDGSLYVVHLDLDTGVDSLTDLLNPKVCLVYRKLQFHGSSQWADVENFLANSIPGYTSAGLPEVVGHSIPVDGTFENLRSTTPIDLLHRMGVNAFEFA